MEYRTLNPTTEEQVETFPLSTEANVETSLATAADRFNAWRRNGIQRRAALLFEVAEALESQADALSRLMALEMGKPLAQGVAEAKKCAWGARYYAENAEALLRPDPRDSDGREAMVRYDPLGPILAVMPWNFPFWQFFRFAAPALIAGNVVSKPVPDQRAGGEDDHRRPRPRGHPDRQHTRGSRGCERRGAPVEGDGHGTRRQRSVRRLRRC
jgi:succinate-semialdehyde dehydrogenase/glutarate-semialdehyde dehydrogenase